MQGLEEKQTYKANQTNKRIVYQWAMIADGHDVALIDTLCNSKMIRTG